MRAALVPPVKFSEAPDAGVEMLLRVLFLTEIVTAPNCSAVIVTVAPETVE